MERRVDLTWCFVYHGAFGSLDGNWKGRAGQVFLDPAGGGKRNLPLLHYHPNALSSAASSFSPILPGLSLQAAPFSCLAELKDMGFSFSVPCPLLVPEME